MKTLEGKKTYIAAGAMVVFAMAGFLFGAISDQMAAGMLIAAFGLFGLGQKSDRYGKAVLAELAEVKQIMATRQAGKTVDVAAEAMKMGGIAIAATTDSQPARIGDAQPK